MSSAIFTCNAHVQLCIATLTTEMGGAGCFPCASRAMILALVLLVVPLVLGAERQDFDQEKYYGQLKVKTTVFNAFPDRNTSAFVLFEEDRINRLAYGETAVKVASLEKHADFIIQFKTIPKEGLCNIMKFILSETFSGIKSPSHGY